MKNILTLLTVILIFIAHSGNAQEWARIGAEWKYKTFQYGGFGSRSFTVEGDTVINGKNCQIILKEGSAACSYRWSWVEFTYEENNKVYFYEHALDTFQVHYDFSNPVPGHSWSYLLDSQGVILDTMVVTIDSVDSVMVGNEYRLRLHVNYKAKNDLYFPVSASTITKELGHSIGMFPASNKFCAGWVDDFTYSGLLCYTYNNVQKFEAWEKACEYTNIREIDPSGTFSIYPNPAGDQMNIELPENERSKLFSIDIYNITGKKVIHRKIDILPGERHFTVNTVDLSSGLYFVRINGEKFRMSRSFVKK